MSELTLSEVIDRPAADVFRFVATDHVRNHPRWDRDMSLTQVDPGPIGVGTRIQRSAVRNGTRIDGEMEVVEFDPDRSMGVVIRDGPVTLRSRMVVEPEADGSTRLTFHVEGDVPVEPMEAPITGSLTRIKQLIESET